MYPLTNLHIPSVPSVIGWVVDGNVVRVVVKREEIEGVVAVVVGVIVVVIDGIVVSDTADVDPISLYHWSYYLWTKIFLWQIMSE